MIEINRKNKIGEGSFGKVYRISPRRVVKVFHSCYSKTRTEEFIKDEIEGSKLEAALPILKIVDVKIGKRQTKGLLKRYIPYPVTPKDCEKFHFENFEEEFWDIHEGNVRKDSRGRLYLIDTQLDPFSI